MSHRFEFDPRLGIRLPYITTEWGELTAEDRHAILLEWEKIRASIPDRIMELEQEINLRQDRVSIEEDWDTICRLYGEIYSIASRINDLHIWSRIEQDFEPDTQKSPDA